MKKKIYRLAIDQYGYKFYFMTIKNLREQIGGGRIKKMYVDKRNHTSKCVGRVIGSHWLTFYIPYEEEV